MLFPSGSWTFLFMWGAVVQLSPHYSAYRTSTCTYTNTGDSYLVTECVSMCPVQVQLTLPDMWCTGAGSGGTPP